MPNGTWKTVELSVGEFLARSVNRELEGGQAFAFPSDLKLSAPPAHHLQDRSSACNRPFILMTLFYWCGNRGPERETTCPRSQRELAWLPSTLFTTPFLLLSEACVCDKKEFGQLSITGFYSVSWPCVSHTRNFVCWSGEIMGFAFQKTVAEIVIFYSNAVCFLSLQVTPCFLLCKTRTIISTSWNHCCIKIKRDNIG